MSKERYAVRAQMLARRDALRPGERALLSQRIVLHIRQWEGFRQAKAVALYMPMRSEADVTALLGTPDKMVYLPTVQLDGGMEFALYQGMDMLVRHHYGMLEPSGPDWVQPEAIDLLLVPGVAFDKQGGRMGYGAGYYDRYLARIRPDAVKLGVCFGAQMRTKVPVSQHDVPMDAIVTETGVFQTEKKDRATARP